MMPRRLRQLRNNYKEQRTMGEPINLTNKKTGKSTTVYGASEAHRLLQEGNFERQGAGLTDIPTEEGVHVEADTTNPTKFSDKVGTKKASNDA
jgi:hypothetical protein